MIRQAYEVDPRLCPKCGRMQIIAFLTDYQAVERIIDPLNPSFMPGNIVPREKTNPYP